MELALIRKMILNDTNCCSVAAKMVKAILDNQKELLDELSREWKTLERNKMGV